VGSCLFYELAETSQDCICKVPLSHSTTDNRMEEDSRPDEVVAQNGI
jgi:hypothetical protein